MFERNICGLVVIIIIFHFHPNKIKIPTLVCFFKLEQNVWHQMSTGTKEKKLYLYESFIFKTSFLKSVLATLIILAC